MIVCKKCGNQNPDGETFCTSCHSFLEWSGEKVVEPPPPPPPSSPPPVEAEPTFVERVKQSVGLEKPKPEATYPPANGSPPIASPGPDSAAQVVDPPAASPPPTSTPIPATPPPQVATPVVPVAVAPAPERARPTPKIESPAAVKYKPGDVICGQCGAGNSPERHFCQRCGANLATAVVVKQPWWRKFIPARTAPAAGSRHQGAPIERAWGTATFRIVALGVIAAVVLAYIVVPPLHDRVNNGVKTVFATAHRHFFPTTTYVRPSDAKASSQLSTHPARLAIDLVKETYWAANTSADKQPWLRLSFGGPVDLDGILLTTGGGNDYASLARPNQVQLVFSDKTTQQLTFKDDPAATSYDISARGVTYVEIHILSVYPSAQSPDVAIAEVEFFKVE